MVSELYGDGSDPTRDHLLAPSEVLLAVHLPVPTSDERGACHRAISRAETAIPRCQPLAQTGYKVGLFRDTVLEVLEQATAPVAVLAKTARDSTPIPPHWPRVSLPTHGTAARSSSSTWSRSRAPTSRLR